MCAIDEQAKNRTMLRPSVQLTEFPVHSSQRICRTSVVWDTSRRLHNCTRSLTLVHISLGLLSRKARTIPPIVSLTELITSNATLPGRARNRASDRETNRVCGRTLIGKAFNIERARRGRVSGQRRLPLINPLGSTCFPPLRTSRTDLYR